MNQDERNRLRDAILESSVNPKVVDSITEDELTYNPAAVWIDPQAPGWRGTTTVLNDEELVRAYLLTKLAGYYGYTPAPEVFEVERVYQPVGRPTGKGGRADVLLRRANDRSCFLFIECKTPDTYDRDLKFIDGQLFRLSLQEQPRPRYLMYYTVQFADTELRNRLILIDTDTFSDYSSWDQAGQPIADQIPANYGRARKKLFANIDIETDGYKPLDKAATGETFSRLREELHNVIWGGGGTNNNEVFTYLVKLILCKIFDEKETKPGGEFRFQRLGNVDEPEAASNLADRINSLYHEAEGAYLSLPIPSESAAFDPARLSPQKLAYVVGRLEGLSVTENVHPGDLLGEFFEQIVSSDFTQHKGQFFTPLKLVWFMHALCDATGRAAKIMEFDRDQHGRPRLPYVIDPSCGSGSFLIEYMKLISDTVGSPEFGRQLASRVREAHNIWFGAAKNAWAREHIFGIESNYDLGLAAKVNMVLHGDGSMNTFINSGLRPFAEYTLERRVNVLGTARYNNDSPYLGKTNEQFDLVLSNPPFSLTLTPDEKREGQDIFPSFRGSISERVFIERWYQLLQPGGKFCCILPETILDTPSNADTRLFLYQFFRIQAVISLPYDSFRPFTSTKTCIVLAEKRTEKQAQAWKEAWDVASRSEPPLSRQEIFLETIEDTGFADEPIFMAEPEHVGYKRRKGLSSLSVSNDLYAEGPNGGIDTDAQKSSVLHSFLYPNKDPSPKFGFWTDLRRIATRNSLRCDPKYRWLWDYQLGVAHGDDCQAAPLRESLKIVKLESLSKGQLDKERPLIDLEQVDSRSALVRPDPPIVEIIGSQKVSFEGCDMAISKLEPYLGKILLDPPDDAIGSTEWIGLEITEDLPKEFVAHLLMLPGLCDAYRRLQSGKRHARFDPEEFLDLRVQLPPDDEIAQIQASVIEARRRSAELVTQLGIERANIDALYDLKRAAS